MNPNRSKVSIASCAVAGLVVSGLLGCDSPKHKIAATPPGKTICRVCYDEIVKTPPHPRYAPMGGTRRVHKCEECKSEATIYEENGVLKIRCSKCAPEGMECDKCKPAE